MKGFQSGEWSTATITWSRYDAGKAAETSFNGTQWVLIKRARRVNGDPKGWYLHAERSTDGRFMGGRYDDAVHRATEAILLSEFMWRRQVLAEISTAVGLALNGADDELETLKAIGEMCFAEQVLPLALSPRKDAGAVTSDG